MKVKKITVYITVVIIFALYLYFANSIMLLIDDNEKLIKDSFENYPEKNMVYQSVDDLQYLGGIYEVAYFQGWAFTETEQDNSDKEIVLLFVSENGRDCYSVSTKAQQRQDVYGVFRDSTKIYNDMNGVECQFSTINMKNGTYHYYVAVIENEMDYGIVDTGLMIEKDAKGMHQFRAEDVA